jgi:hypothetical protein
MPKLMVLPAKDVKEIRVVQIPEDLEEHEAYRHVVGLIAQVEEHDADYCWDDIVAVLEDHQFHPVDFILGPHLD